MELKICPKSGTFGKYDILTPQMTHLCFIVTTFVCGKQPDCKTCLINPGCSWCSDVTGGNCSSECASGINPITDTSTCPGPEIAEVSVVNSGIFI